MNSRHTLYYIFETTILGTGFFLAFLMKDVYNQGLLILGVLLLYISMGAIHHRKTHDMGVKIMLEYVLISALVFSVFLLFKSGAI